MLLAIDTSTRVTGVALYDGVRVLGESVWHSSDYHTVELAPAVGEIVQRAGLKISDLEALAVATGPGSFTGLRIGMALVKGMALARRLPLIGVPTLDVLAAAQPVHKDGFLAGVLRAGRGRLAVGWYREWKGGWQPSGDAAVVSLDEFARRITRPTWVCGELTADERRVLGRKRKNVSLASPAQALRRPAYLAELAWERFQLGQVDDAAALSPIYLHQDQAIPG